MNALADTLLPAAAAPPRGGMAALAKPVEPLPPTASVNDASERFLAPESQPLLSIPVVEHGRVLGIVSRYKVMRVYMQMYGREIYGKRPITTLIDPEPLCVPVERSVEESSHLITERMAFPVMDDFVILRDGSYYGMGIVVDVLKAMEQRIARKNGELAQALANLKSSQMQLVQSEKMASLGQMVAGIAHEINTPLGYVSNNVDLIGGSFDQARSLIRACTGLIRLLTSGEGDEAELEQQMAAIQQASESLGEETLDDLAQLMEDTRYGIGQIGELVSSLKNFARLDQAPVDNVSLNECLDSALLIARNNLKRKAEVVRDYGELPKISCRPSQVNQIFLNLLNNAVQAMEEPGTITVRTWADEEYVNASVSDPGRGIPPELLPRIFDPFFTTKPVGEGTGLGLSICFQIVRQHRGRIRVKSRPGEGTTFTIRLPRTERRPHTPPANQEASQ